MGCKGRFSMNVITFSVNWFFVLSIISVRCLSCLVESFGIGPANESVVSFRLIGCCGISSSNFFLMRSMNWLKDGFFAASMGSFSFISRLNLNIIFKRVQAKANRSFSLKSSVLSICWFFVTDY